MFSQGDDENIWMWMNLNGIDNDMNESDRWRRSEMSGELSGEMSVLRRSWPQNVTSYEEKTRCDS